jgi:SAM-dependent methyltransferase
VNQEIAQKIVNINKAFYDQVGQFWNNQDDYFWEGWQVLVPFIKENRLTNFLDLGCGNARFCSFLEKFYNSKISYTGLDNSDFYFHNHYLSDNNEVNFKFILQDLFDSKWNSGLDKGYFDCISLFGLIHHFPGQQNRLELFKKCCEILKPGGLLIFTTWEFCNEQRLQKRIVIKDSPEALEFEKMHDFKLQNLEENDHILSWVKKTKSYRYSHLFTTEEILFYINSSGLKLLDSFYSDGRFQNRNKYYIAKKLI